MFGWSCFLFLHAWSWIGTAWRFWIVLGESGFQQAVSLIITTHTRTHAHCPLWPRPFPAPGWSIGWCLPCDCREREKKRRRVSVCVVCVYVCLRPVPANRYPSRIRELCLTPGRPCSALAVGVRFLLGFENVRGTSSFTPSLIEVSGHGGVWKVLT